MYVNMACFVLATCSIIETEMSTSKTALFAYQCNRQKRIETHTIPPSGVKEIQASVPKKSIQLVKIFPLQIDIKHRESERERESERGKYAWHESSKKLRNFLIKATAKGQHADNTN